MAAIFDAAWWNFPTNNDYLDFTNLNGEWSFATTGDNFTLMALIEVPTLSAGPHGVIGKRHDASTLKYEEDYGIYLISLGGSSRVRCVIGNSVDANDRVDMVTPITYDTPTLVVLRYTYVGAGNVNTLEAIFVDSTGLTKETLNTADDPIMSSFNTPFWVGGRNGITGVGGKIFWSALFNSNDGLGTAVVSDADLLEFYAQTKHPCDSGDTCTFFVDMHQAVAATYVADHTEMGSINKPLNLTVNGAPTKEGVTTPSFPPDPVNSGWAMDYVDGTATDTVLKIEKDALAATGSLIPAGDFTLVFSYTREDDTTGHICVPFAVGKWVAGESSLGSYLNNISGNVRTYVSSDGTAVDFDDLATATELDNQNVIGLFYDYLGGLGDINPHTQFRVHRTAAGLGFESASENFPGPVFDPAPTSPYSVISQNLGVDTGGKSGTANWVALYHAALTQQDIEDLTSGKKHPVDDFTPVLYLDFHQAVGATYTPEVGSSVVYNVEGSPALVGLGESSLREDYPPSVAIATLTTATNVRVVFDSPMEDNAALNLLTNYSFSGGLSASAITIVNYCTIDLTVSGSFSAGETITVNNVEDILGTLISGKTVTITATFGGTFIAEILIGDTVVWSALNSAPQQTLALDVSDYDGVYGVTFRIRRTS